MGKDVLSDEATFNCDWRVRGVKILEITFQAEGPVQRARVQDIEYSKVLSGCKKIRRKRV